MSVHVRLEDILRGLYRLLAMVNGQPAHLHRVRAVQTRLIEEWPSLVESGPLTVQSALLQEFSNVVRSISGQPLEALCAPAPDSLSAVVADAVRSSTSVVRPDEFTSWLDRLVLSGAIGQPGAAGLIERCLHRLLPDVSKAERGLLIQCVYDAGLLLSPRPRVALVDAHLPHADLADSMLMRGALEGADLRAAKLSNANLRCAVLSRAVLIMAQLDGADLVSANLVSAELAGTALNGAALIDADLSGANLVKASLRHADLTRATLADANLIGCHLDKAVLTSAIFRGSNLLWTDLSEASLAGVDLTGAVYNVHTRWPRGFDVTAWDLILID